MAKFKVGDRVRIKPDASGYDAYDEFVIHRYRRDVATVRSFDKRSYVTWVEVEFAGDGPHDGWLMKEDELEPAAMVDPAELNLQIRAYFASDFIAALDDTAPALPVLPALPPLPLGEDTLLDLILNESDELKPKRIVQYPFGRNGESLL